MKEGRDLFNVAMGTYDGVEIYRFVGTFSFEKMDKICNPNGIGLYWDKGLSVFRNKKSFSVR